MSKKWNELREAIGPGELMTKRRNSQAVAAWSRHQGAHSPGTKKPELDDTEEQMGEYFEGTPAQHHEDFLKELDGEKTKNEDCEFDHPECTCILDSKIAKANGLLYTGHCKAFK